MLHERDEPVLALQGELVLLLRFADPGGPPVLLEVSAQFVPGLQEVASQSLHLLVCAVFPQIKGAHCHSTYGR